MKQNKKQLVALSLAVLLAVFTIFRGSFVARADHDGKDLSSNPESLNQEELDQQDQEIDDDMQEESAINTSVDTQMQQLQGVAVPELDQSQLTTYGDAVTYLQQLLTALNSVQNVSATDPSTVGGQLSDAEKALLGQLLTKHQTDFSNLGSRVTDLQGQIQKLIDLLTPIATQDIATSSGIRRLLVIELKDFADQTKKLVQFGGLDIQILNDETE